LTILVLFVLILAALSALLGRILLTRLAAVLALAGLTALLALSGLIVPLILLVHIICHENFLLTKYGAFGPIRN
jgi:small-conductance mechanosensitive channel